MLTGSNQMRQISSSQCGFPRRRIVSQRLLCLWLSAIALGSFWQDISQAEPPCGLLCELLRNPAEVSICDPRPEFSWIVQNKSSSIRQSAYQIRVREVGQAKLNTLWDSRRVSSVQSTAIEYAGKPLRPGSRYTWQVRVWDDNGEASEWSQEQHFNTSETWDRLKTLRQRVSKTIREADSCIVLDDGARMYDLGKAAFGYLELDFEVLTSDRQITVHLGEKLACDRVDLEPGGTIRSSSISLELRKGQSRYEIRPPADEMNTSGKGAILLPSEIGVITPFRYVEIVGLAKSDPSPTVRQIAFWYPFDDQAADFFSSDPILNSVWELCKYSIKATTYCGIYIDGDRERIPYEADAYLNQLSHYCVDREYALARYSHEYLLEHPTWPTEWKQHSVLMAWADYLNTGDIESLARHYDCLRHQKVLEKFVRSDGLLDTSSTENSNQDVIDWPPGERDGYELGAVNTVVNAFHLESLRLMSEIASALGNAEDAAAYHQRATDLRIHFNETFLDKQQRRYIDAEGSTHTSLHANMFPLAFGLVPPEEVGEVADFVEEKGMACSVYGAQYLLEALYRSGRDHSALDLMRSKGPRSWWNMIREGSTITLEAWGAKWKPNLDWNHAWGAVPSNIIPRYLAGIRPVQPGATEIVVQPQPGNLKHFRVKTPTVRGPVELQYRVVEGGYQLVLVLPGNVTTWVGLHQVGDSGESLDLPVVHNGKLMEPSRVNPPKGAIVAEKFAWMGPFHGGTHTFLRQALP